ncbi:dynein regulatory complex protein 11 [Anguilla anguilla]|uniref:dynein regulatory complex protein 11 n=1 Tax=Anguilla anguilla TaxID=7936 RepID=UPI0015AC2482|nr:dynein regulatory complex protein 11 [Anguilla anguilla]
MSHSTYGRMWTEAQGALQDMLEEELPAVPPRPQKDRLLVFQTLATFYVKYLQILRSLEAVYDQMVHPQKRRVVRHVLDGVTGRLLELKNEMVELEFSEFHYYDDILQDLKLTPGDLEVPIPRYFVSEKLRVLREREKLLAQILARGEHLDPAPEVRARALPIDEAVRLVQVSERARQGRLRASFMKEIRREEERYRQGRNCNGDTLDPNAAATLIQKVWLGYSTRKRMKKERLEEMVFLGMVPPPQQGRQSAAQVRMQQVECSRRLLQEKHEADFLQAKDKIKDSVREVEGPDMQQTLQEQIRQWFIECRDATGKFPDFPSIDEGGSAAIFAQKTPEQVAAELAAKEEEKEKRKKSKGKKGKSSGKEKKKDRKGKGKGKKSDADSEEETGWKMPPSSFLPAVVEGANTYKEVWQHRDESQNFTQTFDAQLVREEKRVEVEEEVRVQVDELMRQELKNLKIIVDRVKDKKKKKGKKKSKKKKKKGKTSKKKKRREKDQTADRTIESLYEELVLEGVLIKPLNVKLSEYIGEYSYLGTTLRQADIEPMPSLSDVRQLVALYGILPLGSQAVHERAPLVKTLLLAGPAGVGKRMLVHALCTETGANLFNLSPANLAGKYPGRSGLQYLLHVVFKVARLLQPSVIWIGDAEKTFYKKIPKPDKEMEPKRLKKDLPKLLKLIKPEDRVLIVGTTQRPFDADLKPLCKVYRKIILIPRPDYATRLALWSRSLEERGGQLSPELDLSSLAKVTDGYTQGRILRAVQAVLTQRRLDLQTQRPLRALEFIPPLARQDPVYKDEEETFKAWYSRTPLGKKRARAARASEEGEMGNGPEKGGKGKKKMMEGKAKGKKKQK